MNDQPAGEKLKIFVVVGSPRNEESVSYQVLEMLRERMGRVRPVEFEYLFLERFALPFCDGCLSCIRKGEEFCPDYEKIDWVVKKVEAADGIILSAPVHTFNVAGLMKNFCEYFMYKRNRPSFFGKKALVHTTAAGGGHDVVLDFLERTAVGWGCDVVSRLGVSSSQMSRDVYVDLVTEACDDMSRKLVHAIENEGIASPKFKDLMNFRVMQIMTSRATKTKNYAYWKERGWLETEYYKPVRLNPFSRVMVNFIAWRIRSAMRKGKVKVVR